MTIKELKNKLNEYNDNDLVLVSGYEAGYDDIDSINVVNVFPDNINEEGEKIAWYLGKYSNDEAGIKAVVLGG